MEEPFVRIEHLTVRSGRDLIYGLTMDIRGEDNIVFFGPERSGFLSLVMILLGINVDYDGRVFYRGRLIKDFNYIERHNHKRHIGYLHGDYGLLSNMSVEENISLPLDYHSELSKEEIAREVDELVREFDLVHCRTIRPIGLTGAEIFRTAYARAIVDNPDILIVDQAFVDHAAINLITVNNNLRKRLDDPSKCTLFFTYQPKIFLDFTNKFVMFYNGGIVFEGDRDSFLRCENDYLRQYLQSSSDGPMKF